MRKKVRTKKCSLSYDFEVQKYDNSFIKTCDNCIKVQEHLNKIDSLKHKIRFFETKLKNKIIEEQLNKVDFLKNKIKYQQRELKCLDLMFKQQVKILTQKIRSEKNSKSQNPIINLMNPLIILKRCDENRGIQKEKCFLQKKNVIKEETDEEKLN